jgi:Flp pilus assembly protein TadD
MMLGQLALEARKPDQALDSFARALSLMPGLVDAQLMHAVALQTLHRDAEAERYLRGLLAASTEPGRLHRMIGELAFERGDYASAVMSFEAALAAAPRSAPAHHAIALALHRRGDDTSALRAVDRAISLESDRWEYVYDRACILATLGRVEEALAGLSSAIERGFDRPQAFDTDPDLATLRTDARFRALRARVARRASNVRSPR